MSGGSVHRHAGTRRHALGDRPGDRKRCERRPGPEVTNVSGASGALGILGSYGACYSQNSRAPGEANEFGIAMAVDGIVDIVHCGHSVVLGVHCLHVCWRNSAGEGQDHVSKDIETDGTAGVVSRWLWIPGMHSDLVGELIAQRAIRLADLENGSAVPVGAARCPMNSTTCLAAQRLRWRSPEY